MHLRYLFVVFVLVLLVAGAAMLLSGFSEAVTAGMLFVLFLAGATTTLLLKPKKARG
ncbi:hypothetical protein [Shouchella shacheensis]|uniref:hypothetical protein n=1 Tax=Shouchella shacheensis TaxID=1649580 RepID=UPI000A95F971|nr:hypothetical protein [Shouchella shacheensis]